MKNVFCSSKSRFFLGPRCGASPSPNAAVSAAVVPAVRRGRWQQAAAVPASPSSSCLILREPRTESRCLQVSPSGGGCGGPRDHVWYPSRCSLAPGALRETDPLWSRQRAGAHRLREDGRTPAPAAAPLTYKGRISSEEKNGSLAAAFPSLLQQQIGRSWEFWCLENWILNRERLWTPSHPK